jgi:DNA-binding NarL/FixJ family response regulator
MTAAIRVLIVDDHPVVRLGLRTMLESETDISVVAMAATAREAIQEAENSHPDVVLIDLRMPEMSGVDAIAILHRDQPDIRILVLTNYQEDEYVRQAFAAGAMGYLLKNTPQEEIVQAIRSVHHNERYFPPSIAERLLGTLGRESLSERELEVLKLVAKGLSNKEIANVLCISDKTARNHVAKCLAKLGADDRTEATMTAVVRGLIDLN